MRSNIPVDSGQSRFLDLLNQIHQFDHSAPLIALGYALDWKYLESEFAPLYRVKGRPAKLIRLMCGLLMLKQLDNLSGNSVAQKSILPSVLGEMQPLCLALYLVGYYWFDGTQGKVSV